MKKRAQPTIHKISAGAERETLCESLFLVVAGIKIRP